MYKSLSLSICLVAVLICQVEAAMFGLFEKKKYTPLVMFKVPKGTIAECDEMEKVVKKVEKELNTKVERFDILRDRFARNLYEKVDEIEFAGKVPLLYNRESRQIIYGLDSKSRVKAWAKGRFLSPKIGGDSKAVRSQQFVADEGEPEGEFYEEDLTELQQLGKERMLERLESESEASE